VINVVFDASGLQIIQPVGRSSALMLRLKEVLAVKRSKYQEIVIGITEEFGKTLVLDGYVQSTEADEYLYHESLVQPAMLSHPNPRRVLILGGGEGATAREVLKHPVERVTMVDIDEDVVELSKKFLEEMHRGAFNDPRLHVVIADGREYLLRTSEKYDVIISDLTDPYSSEIAKELYTEPFFITVKNRLTDVGIFVTQAGSRFFYEETYNMVLQGLKSVFRYVMAYSVWVPSFGYACEFIMASDSIDFNQITAQIIDQRMLERRVRTKFFNGKVLEAFKLLPSPTKLY